MAGLADRFADALRTLEESRDPEPLVDLYAAGARVGNIVHPEQYDGRTGARSFWTSYRDQFEDVRSSFRLSVEDDTGGVLEWESEVTIAGHRVQYRGATVLEFVDGAITRSCTYFDPTALRRQQSFAD